MRTAILAVAVAAFGVLTAPAGLASADEKSAQETIDELTAQGYTVTIDKMGTAPISECVVTGVRNRQQFSQWVPVVGPLLGQDSGDGNVLVQSTYAKSVSVSLDCTR